MNMNIRTGKYMNRSLRQSRLFFGPEKDRYEAAGLQVLVRGMHLFVGALRPIHT